LKNIPIDYTSREFASIKASLVEHAKRYYPTNYKDFSEASFGSLMLDSVAYVGDILSFYLDYQVNEFFIDTALEVENIVKHAQQLGYKYDSSKAAFGTIAAYIIVPASSTGIGPDQKYLPVMRRGSSFSSLNGASYTLTDNIDFADTNNEIVPADINPSTGLPTSYAVKAHGRIVSGIRSQESFILGDYSKFLRLELSADNVTEIISVVDGDGKEYFEVDYLSQDVVYKSVANKGTDKELVKDIMKPISVPRRFTVYRSPAGTHIQFGQGSEEDIDTGAVADPSEVALQMHGKNYVSDSVFDPSKLLSTDKLGVAPSNTTITVSYRVNSNTNANSAAGAVTEVNNAILEFSNPNLLDRQVVLSIRQNIEVINPEPINGHIEQISEDEIRIRARDSFSTQNRAVTRQDYISMCYRMPPRFGGIKRANVVQDRDSFKRNINLYIIAEDENGKSTKATQTLKNNLKMWISRNKMVNDTVDILDAKILNLGIDFSIIAEPTKNKHTVLSSAINALKEHFMTAPEIGEPLQITDIYRVLNKLDGVVDTTGVKIRKPVGTSYESINYNVDLNTSADGRTLHIPENVIYEIRFPETDIRGEVR